jgi:hypothetical protein
MDKLILEDVRCFRGRHELPLAPLTILVGENSTGKSTVLAAARVAAEVCQTVGTPDFNAEPFDWGAYDQIACTRGGRGGRAKSFSIGYELDDVSQNHGDPVYVESGGKTRAIASFGEKNAQPRICQWQCIVDDCSITVDLTDESNVTAILTDKERSSRRFPLKLQSAFPTPVSILVNRMGFGPDFGKSVDIGRCDMALYRLSLRNMPYAFAPIRTRPRRTYDRRADTPSPEGGHVPIVLATLKTSSPKEWADLKSKLTEFGRECGLFKSVNVRSLGKESDPFQVQITVNGSPTNLIDVGYGVSQALPLLVDCLEEANQLLLIQQPEVHLHPKAQAQLGSFFGYLVRKHEKRFIVETHSDFLVDRIRMDVGDGKYGLRPEDVGILYFERKAGTVSVHPMQIDECGNLLGAPPGYRQFFLEEEKKFIGG